MSPKSSILTLTTTSLLLLAGVRAQEFKDLNIWSGPSCGDDPNDLETLTHQLSFSPDLGGKFKDAQWSACYGSQMDLSGWEKTDEGKYQVYVDTSDLDGNCWLNFYSTHPDSGFACQNKYKSFPKSKNTCPLVALSQGFGYAMCCGTEDACFETDVVYDGQVDKRDSNASEHRAPVSNVADVRRAPLLSRAARPVEPRDDKCKFVKKSGTEVVHGRQIKKTEVLPCPKDQTTCGVDYSHTVGREVTDSVSVSVSVGAEFFKVLSAEMSVGYEHAETAQESFTSTVHFGPTPGHHGYVTFRPKYLCAKGHTEGDCSGEKLEPMEGRKWCMPKTLPGGKLDGDWEIVEVD